MKFFKKTIITITIWLYWTALRPTPGHSDQLQATLTNPRRFKSLQATPSTPDYSQNLTTRYSKPSWLPNTL